MRELLKRFWNEEDGIEVVEIVIIIGVLVGIALMFRTELTKFVSGLIDRNLSADSATSQEAQKTS